MLQRGTILVTGANGGLGNAIVSHILNHRDLNTNYYGIYTVRDAVRGATTVRRTLERAESVKHDHELLAMDLGSLDSVRQAARDINNRVASGTLPPIRAFVLNAGWGEQTTQSFTNDGFDMSFQVNYLSHFLLTLLLLQSMDKKHGRIEVLSSWTHEYIIPYFLIKGFLTLHTEPS
jgi:NAD(P)-dependent dehydrogenase (short-subunit alcohol dehydrogenase family)